MISYYFDPKIKSKKFQFVTLGGRTVHLDKFGMNHRPG